MNKKWIVLAGTWLLLVASIGIALHCVHSAREAELARGALALRKARSEEIMQRLSNRLAAAKRAGSALSAAPTIGKTDQRAKQSTAAEQLRKFDEKQKDPKVQLALLAANRAKAAASYGRLFRILGLTPDQLEKFQDHVAKRDEANMDLTAVLWAEAQASGGTLSAETQSAMQALDKKTQSEYQAAQTDLLGEAGYAQAQEYERALPAQDLVSNLAGSALLAGAPLTTQQAETLIPVVAKASSAYAGGNAASLMTTDWEAVDAQAEPILSASQVAVLKSVQAALFSRVNKAVNQAARRDRESQPPATAPTPGN